MRLSHLLDVCQLAPIVFCSSSVSQALLASFEPSQILILLRLFFYVPTSSGHTNFSLTGNHRKDAVRLPFVT